MLAVLNAPQDPARVRFAEVEEPVAAPDQVVVAVRAVSLNRGELTLLRTRPEGWRPGQDVAGVVVAAAEDGSGPAVGTRVVAIVDEAGWAERVAVHTDQLAPLPDDVPFTTAATLPIAGVTALRTLRLGGDLLGKRVLITAATGAVGRFQVQLANARGAHVTAVTTRTDLEGAELVPSTESAPGLYAFVSESLGGPGLAAAVSKSEPGGTVVVLGSSTGEPGALSIYDFIGHENTSLHFFLSYASGPFGPDLALLAELVSGGTLTPTIARTDTWTELPAAITALTGREISGKAVLTIP